MNELTKVKLLKLDENGGRPLKVLKICKKRAQTTDNFNPIIVPQTIHNAQYDSKIAIIIISYHEHVRDLGITHVMILKWQKRIMGNSAQRNSQIPLNFVCKSVIL